MKKQSLVRKLLAFMLAFVLSAGLAMPVMAANNEGNVLTVEVDGVEVEFADQGPLMVAGGTVMVPVRGVFEHMGFTPSWDGATGVATLTSDDTTVIIPAGGTTITVNGETITPAVPPLMLNGRIMLPLRAVAEALGATPQWDGETQTARILTDVAEEPEELEEDVEEPADEEVEDDYEYPVVEEDEEPADEDDANNDADTLPYYGLVGTWIIEGTPSYMWSTTFYADGTGKWVNNNGDNYFVWSVEDDVLTRVWEDDIIWSYTYLDGYYGHYTNVSSIQFSVIDGILTFYHEGQFGRSFIPY